MLNFNKEKNREIKKLFIFFEGGGGGSIIRILSILSSLIKEVRLLTFEKIFLFTRHNNLPIALL